MADPGPRPLASPDQPACLTDPLSVHGLRKLQRDQPDRWAITLGSYLPDPPTLTADMAVRWALMRGTLDWDAMQKLGAAAFRRHRQSCARAVQVAGTVKLGEITDDVLREVRGKLVRKQVASESISRTLTILRKLARTYAEETGSKVLVTSRPTRVVASRVFVRPTKRPLWSPEEIARLLAMTRDRGARVAVALAVGCGMGPGEVLHVAVGDLDLKKHLVVVHGEDRSDAARVMPLPPWVEDLVRDYIAGYGRQGRAESPWLFPATRDPRGPRGDFSRLLQAAHKRAGGLDQHPPVTLLAVRRTFQWACLRGGLPRECVRGTWSIESGGDFPPWWPKLRKLVRVEWKTLTGLDRERWPRGCTSFVRTVAGLLPSDLVEARRRMLREPPPLPPSAAG